MTTIDTHATGTAGLSGDSGTVAVAGHARSGGAPTASSGGSRRPITSASVACSSASAPPAPVRHRGRRAARHRAGRLRPLRARRSTWCRSCSPRYRVGLIFVVLVPALLGLSVAVVPLQLGARAAGVPPSGRRRLLALVRRADPRRHHDRQQRRPRRRRPRMVEGFLCGSRSSLLLGLFAAAVSLATSVLTTRAPGHEHAPRPAVRFASLVGALVLVLVLPVLIGALILTSSTTATAGRRSVAARICGTTSASGSPSR